MTQVRTRTAQHWLPEIREANVPDRLPDSVTRGPLIDAEPTQILFRIPEVGRFLVTASGPVRRERASGAADSDLECFRRGPVAAAAMLLAGQPLLRAAAVEVGGNGTIICGPPAAGASTLMAALAVRGNAVLADRLGLIPVPRPVPRPVPGPELSVDPPRLTPTDTEVQLWPDMAARLGLDPAMGREIRPGLAKRAFTLGTAAEPVPLHTVLVLHHDRQNHHWIEETPQGGQRLAALLGREWHHRLVQPLGFAPARFRWLALIAQHARVVHLRGNHRVIEPLELAKLVEGLFP
jgi:hypothetical protein